MKRFLLTFTLLMFLVSDILCQGFTADFQKGARSFFSVNAGASIPGGRFSQKSLYSNYNNPYDINVPKLPRTGSENFNVLGYANVGFSVSVNTAWYFNKFLGIGLRASMNVNSLATNKMTTVYQNAFSDASDFVFNTSGSYKSYYAMPGVYFALPISDFSTVTLDAGFGPQMLSTPQIECSYNYNNISHRESTVSVSNWDFSYYVSLGFKYEIDDNLAVNIDVVYNELAMEMDLETMFNRTPVKGTYNLFYVCPSFNVGLVYLFK